MPKKWNFLSNYGLVIIHIVQNPSATLREIARSTDLTERAVYQIVRDLEHGGFIGKKRVGRRNYYTIDKDVLFSHPVGGGLNLAQLTAVLGRLIGEGREAAGASP